ncbi:hypothetical protein T4E_3583 [Trichinella pseudospiralis]|uniref:Uncharacterized protein n=1 Tax=Trichinella pseudospiralis TaxID=6337 RepID=A0A0V0XP75_TRIPS|nr:hypothetical protein T4E_3583 [Trichinella pseudospiralis]
MTVKATKLANSLFSFYEFIVLLRRRHMFILNFAANAENCQ